MSDILLNVGCGGNRLPGFINTDIDLDIRMALPYPPNSVRIIFAEHVLEHISVHDAYNFMVGAKRALETGGVLRLAVPSVVKIAYESTPNYLQFLKDHGWGDGTPESAVRSIIFNHGHEMAWSEELLIAILYSIGFRAYPVELGKSAFPELIGVEGHHTVIGSEFNALETVVVEAVKP